MLTIGICMHTNITAIPGICHIYTVNMSRDYDYGVIAVKHPEWEGFHRTLSQV